MPLDPRHVAIIARELEALAIEIEEIGITLCSDPALIATHGGALQAIDFISQRQRSLAVLLSADDLTEALQQCCLEHVVSLFSDATVPVSAD